MIGAWRLGANVLAGIVHPYYHVAAMPLARLLNDALQSYFSPVPIKH
jgi:hypothetical protein